jgi:hypothetical protein
MFRTLQGYYIKQIATAAITVLALDLSQFPIFFSECFLSKDAPN